MQLTDYELKSIGKFEKSICDGKWSNDGLVSLLKLITDDYLNAKKVSLFAENHKISTQWARQRSDVFKIDGVQFIPDNE